MNTVLDLFKNLWNLLACIGELLGYGPAVRSNPSDTCNAGRDYFQATYIQTDLYQQDSCRLNGLGLGSVSIDSATEGSLE